MADGKQVQLAQCYLPDLAELHHLPRSADRRSSRFVGQAGDMVGTPEGPIVSITQPKRLNRKSPGAFCPTQVLTSSVKLIKLLHRA